MSDDAINPPHYDGDECMRFIEALELDFALGSAVKYLWRLGRKDGDARELGKSEWYVNRFHMYNPRRADHDRVASVCVSIIAHMRGVCESTGRYVLLNKFPEAAAQAGIPVP